MEVRLPPALALPPPPFQRSGGVQEWRHLDSVTGALETGRVETGRWAATTSNSSHHFGQVVDLRARNRADGSQEQRRQKKQLEVFQASIPGGSVQVIRSQTTTSSWHGQSTTSSKLDSGMSFGWSHSMNNSSSQSKSIEKRTSDESSNQTNRSDDKSTSRLPEMHFDNLQLAIHPLDLSPQKTKASVGRSGSISGRRPPTRPRSIAGTGQGSDVNTKSTTIKDQQQQRWQSSSASSLISKTSSETKSVFSSRRDDILNPVSLFSITGNRGDVDLFPVRLEDEGNKKKLFRMKSCSSEDLRLSPDSNHEDADDKGGADEWRRDSLERRSLQLPPVQPRNLDKKQTNVMRSRVVESHNTTRHSFISSQPKDVEKQTVIDRLKGTGWKSIEDVLKKNFDNQLSNSRNGLDSLVDGMVSPSEERSENRSATKKKNTFITVESLNAVRGRLRRTDSFSELLPGVERSNENIAPIEQEDDGILTEPHQSSTSVNDLGKSDPKSVKSFVYGIETVLQGDRRTGSLETRGNSKIDGSNGLTSKTEEWYNRRKSYGFEPVRQQQQSIANRYSSNLNTKINLAESTDSGICRSSETVANTATPWYTPTVSNKYTTADNNESRRTSHTITIKNSFNYDNLLSDSKSSSRIELLSKGIGSKGKRTVVTVGNEDQDNWRSPSEKIEVDKKIEKEADKFETSNGSSMLSSANVNLTTLQESVLKDEEKEIVPRGKVADALRSLREKSSLNNSFAAKRLSEPITISIPSPVEDSENAEVNDFLLKQTKDPLETDRYKFKKFLDSETKNVQTSYSKLIFGEGKIKTMSKSFDGQADNDTPSNRFNLRPVSKINQPEFKRHSIAVDETKYITNKSKDSYELSSSAINENSNFRLNSNSSTFVSPYTSKLKPSDNGHNKGDSSGDNDSNDKKQKKVEFCKTEVHFAAEPGRFNIVETDGKPPSNMNFRRRRKTISESTPRNTSNLPEIRFGDLQYEKALLTNKPDNMNEEFIIKTVQKEDDQIATTVPKDEVITILPETIHPVSSKIDGNGEKFHSSSLLDAECEPIYDEKTLDMNVDNYVKPRSILKSNATLNENKDGQFYVAVVSDDKHIANHGIVRLNADGDDILNKTSTFLDQKGYKSNDIQVSRAHKSSSKTTITSDVKSRSDCEDQVETELQKLLKSLRPTPRRSLFSTDDELSDSCSNYPQTPRYRNSMSDQNSSMAADNGLAVHISSKPTWSSRSPSTAENSHKIEEYKSKGFSTRVNFGSEETMVVNSESVKKGLLKEQMSSPYSTEVSSRIFSQPSNSSDNNVGVQQDGNAVSTTTHIRFNAAPDLNHRLTTNKHNNEVTVTSLSSHSPLLVTSSSDNENMSSASLVLKMLLNRAAQSRRREIGTQKSDKHGNETEVTQRNRSAQSYIEDSVTLKKPGTPQFYTAHTSVSSINPGINDGNYNGKDKSSPSTEQRMMKMISSQHNQHLDLIKEMDKYNGTIPEVRREEIGNRNLDMDEREERLSRVSNDSILEALENLSKQIENDIIEIPKIKDVKKEVKLKNSSVFKVIEDTGETRMKRFLRRRTDSNLSQSQLSDDTLQADEEVKSYMSAVNDVRKISDSSDSDDAASKTKNCDRLTNFNRRNRRVVKNRTKEPCTSQIAQGIISQPKNKLPDDIPKGQSTAKFYSDSTNEKSHSDSTKSVETLVSTRSGHPRITSISLRYNDNHETNGAVFETPSSANKKYSRSSICIEPCDSGSSTTDISSSWKWSKGSKQSVRASAQNVSLSNIYSNATRTIEPVSSREDITALPDDDSAAALGYPKTKPTRIVTEDYQRKQVTKSASDQCVLLSSGKPQFGKVTAVVPPTVAYSSSVVLNYQPSPTQVTDNITTQHRSYQASTSTNARRGSKSEGVEKSKAVSEQRNVGNYRKNVSVSTSGRRDSWLNVPKDVSTSQVEQTRQSREVKVEKQRKKSSTAVVDVRKKKKTTDGGLVEDCSDDLMRRGRESPIYANSNVFAHDYTAPTSSDRAETESFILEELTKAADEILRAVNGYTDDDSSFRGSSDDEPGKRYGRERKFSSSKPLGTISETPTRVKSQVVETKVRSTAVKSRLCKTSSNSSVEGGGSSADSKPLMEKPSKRRNVRLLQRASSREMLMKSRGAASSSEDVQSGSEQAAPPPRVSRMKTSRHTSQHQKSTIASQSRTKERVQKTVSSGDVSGVKAQSTVVSAASSRTRHDARKRTTTKSTTSSASATASARRLAVGGRQSPEGAEQAVKKEAAGGESRLSQPRDEPQPRARPVTANRAAAAARTANRSSTAAAVYVPRTTSRPHYRNHARRKRRRGTAARSQHWPQCPCV